MDPLKPLLSIENLSISFGKKDISPLINAVKDISFTVNRGEIVAVVGESGSGKTVTALSLLQLNPAKSTFYPTGKLLFSKEGKNSSDLLQISHTELNKIRGSDISMIFQEPMTSLNPVFTCGEQVMETILQHKKINKEKARQETIELFNRVQLPEPEIMLKKYPHEISGGQKQRVMIAMAISCNPSLLIADEPTTALDVTVQKNILELLANLQSETNMGLLFITHDLAVVKNIAHKVVVLYRGQLVEQNTTAAIFSNPQHPYTKALLACRPANFPKGKRLPVVSDFWNEATANTAQHSDQSNSSEIAAIPVANFTPLHESAKQHDAPLLTIDSLTVKFPAHRNLLGKVTRYQTAIDNISFQIFEGETLGIVGESGSGKTTLGRAILRLIPASSGAIYYTSKNENLFAPGKQVESNNPLIDLLKLDDKSLQQLRKEMQIVFQDPYTSLNPTMKVGHAIEEAMLVHKIADSKTARRIKTMELFDKVNLQQEQAGRYPHAFSGGQRQRIGIARALSVGAGFIVFDESVSALDVSVQAQVLNLINELKASLGFTALFISHDLNVVRYISDRILVLNKGKIEEIDSAEQVFNHPQADYTRKLLASIPK